MSPPTAVIAVEPAIIYSFVNKACRRGERVDTSVNTIQIAPLALFLCKTAENSNNSYSQGSYSFELFKFHDFQ